ASVSEGPLRRMAAAALDGRASAPGYHDLGGGSGASHVASEVEGSAAPAEGRAGIGGPNLRGESGADGRVEDLLLRVPRGHDDLLARRAGHRGGSPEFDA